MDENQITGQAIGAAVEVHKALGPGLLEAQLLTYLRLTGIRVGLLINFNVPVLKQGIRRTVNDYSDSAPQRLRG